MASAARIALPPWLRVLRAASAGGFFASGGTAPPPYVLKQRGGSGGAFDGSGGSGSGGGRQVRGSLPLLIAPPCDLPILFWRWQVLAAPYGRGTVGGAASGGLSGAPVPPVRARAASAVPPSRPQLRSLARALALSPAALARPTAHRVARHAAGADANVRRRRRQPPQRGGAIGRPGGVCHAGRRGCTRGAAWLDSRVRAGARAQDLGRQPRRGTARRLRHAPRRGAHSQAPPRALAALQDHSMPLAPLLLLTLTCDSCGVRRPTARGGWRVGAARGQRRRAGPP